MPNKIKIIKKDGRSFLGVSRTMRTGSDINGREHVIVGEKLCLRGLGTSYLETTLKEYGVKFSKRDGSRIRGYINACGHITFDNGQHTSFSKLMLGIDYTENAQISSNENTLCPVCSNKYSKEVLDKKNESLLKRYIQNLEELKHYRRINYPPGINACKKGLNPFYLKNNYLKWEKITALSTLSK